MSSRNWPIVFTRSGSRSIASRTSCSISTTTTARICSDEFSPVNETLFSQIQRLFERTYAQVGINLEDCLIDQRRCRQLSKLAGASAAELSELGRTFLRTADDQLYVGIYYSRWLIKQLEEHDPRAGLSDRNIRSLIMFVEELN